MTTAAVAAGLALGLTACSTTGTTGPAADDATGTAKPHGYVEGASEAQEPQGASWPCPPPARRRCTTC